MALSGSALQELLRAVLDRGVPFRFTALGFSMHPFIQDGDTVTVSPRSGEEIRAGDVVAFCQPGTGRLVVHRVLTRASGGYLLRGDNALEEDDLIPPQRVFGLVTRVERRGRKVLVGRGPERRLIAWLARRGLLQPLICRAWQVIYQFVGRSEA